MPNKCRNHEDSLKTICTICWSKGRDLRPLSSSVQQNLKEHVFPDYDKDDQTFPRVAVVQHKVGNFYHCNCPGCRRDISESEVRLDNNWPAEFETENFTLLQILRFATF